MVTIYTMVMERIYTVDFAPVDVNDALFKRVEDQIQKPSTKRNLLYPTELVHLSEPASPSLVTCLNFTYSLECHDGISGRHVYFDKQKLDAIKETFCCSLYGMLDDPAGGSTGPVSRLDSLLSSIVFEYHLYDHTGFNYLRDREKVVAEACSLVRRLPLTPVELPDETNIVASEHMDPVAFGPERHPQARTWENLEVVTVLSTNVIRVALLVAMSYPSSTYSTLENFLNLHADLCSTASHLYTLALSEEEKCNWFLVRAFLWTCWQRMSQLYFYSAAGESLRTGFLEFARSIPPLRVPSPVTDMSTRKMLREFMVKNKPHYMCGYAFELIRTNPCALGLDFRNFMDR